MKIRQSFREPSNQSWSLEESQVSQKDVCSISLSNSPRLEVAHGKGGLSENVVMNLRAHSRGPSPRSSLQLEVCETCFHGHHTKDQVKG